MNTTICPTCGHSNNCAVANKHNPKQCWCMQETIDQQLLKQLAEQYQQSACICQQCLKKFRSPNHVKDIE